MRPSLRHQASDVEVFPDTPLMSRDTEDHDVFEEHVVKFQSALAGEACCARLCGPVVAAALSNSVLRWQS
jgi:hypothetical protein